VRRSIGSIATRARGSADRPSTRPRPFLARRKAGRRIRGHAQLSARRSGHRPHRRSFDAGPARAEAHNTALVGHNDWESTIIEGPGVDSNVTIGLLFAVQNMTAVMSLIVVSRHSDRTLERRYHAALPCWGMCHRPRVNRLVLELPPDCVCSACPRNDRAGDGLRVVLAVPADAARRHSGRWRPRAHQLDWQFLGLGRAIRIGWLRDVRGSIRRPQACTWSPALKYWRES
jgi:hypothetical protein